MKLRQGFSGAPAAAAGSENGQQVPWLACSPRRGQACFFLMLMRVGCVQGVSQKGNLDGLPTPLVVLCAGSTAVPCFCSKAPQK